MEPVSRGRRPAGRARAFLSLALGIVILLGAAVLAGCGSSAPPAQPLPEQPPPTEAAPEAGSPYIRETHLTCSGEPASAMTVNWVSDPTTPGAVVEFGTAPDFGSRVEGSTEARGQQLFHTVELTDLAPDTLYYYRCGDGAAEWSARFSFRTAPIAAPSGEIVFAVMGDSRNGPATFARLAEAAHAIGPDFTLYTGDAVDNGTSPLQWMEWFEAAGDLDSDAPLMPTLGNHEGNAALYFQQFDLPGNERWYSFDWGNVHVVCLDTEAGLAGEQESWLEADLAAAAANPAITWKVVFFHQPPFSSGWGHGSNQRVREAWCPLFDTFGVNLVLSGHEHNYERSGPVNYSLAPAALMPDWNDARCYVVTGGGGAPLSPLGTSWWTEARGALFHWVEVRISGTILHLATHDLAGNTIDSLELTK